MVQDLIFLPVIALAALTFTVLGQVPLRRFGAAFAKQVTPADFALGESSAVPPTVALANRNYMNLLELPVLFYVVCLALFVSDLVDILTLKLAWTYVGLRVVHSLVHLTYNKVMHRLALFAASQIVLMTLWGVFALRLWPSVS